MKPLSRFLFYARSARLSRPRGQRRAGHAVWLPAAAVAIFLALSLTPFSVRSAYNYQVTDPLVGSSLSDINTAFWETWTYPSGSAGWSDAAISSEGLLFSGFLNYLGNFQNPKWVVSGDFRVSLYVRNGPYNYFMRTHAMTVYEILPGLDGAGNPTRCAQLRDYTLIWGGSTHYGPPYGSNYYLSPDEEAYFMFVKQGASISLHKGDTNGVSESDPVVAQLTVQDPDSDFILYAGTGSPNYGSVLIRDFELQTERLNACDDITPVPPQWSIGAVDSDGDGINDPEDNCPMDANPDQADTDLDGVGNTCDEDDDNDGVADEFDNCPTTFPGDPDQTDTDSDGAGDACDIDADGDGIENSLDNCPAQPNPYQDDTDNDGTGDACDPDTDNDSICDGADPVVDVCAAGPDNCPSTVNPDQADADTDGIGDVCDADRDGDGVDNDLDNCPDNANTGQDNTDWDAFGDACDTDDDNDGICDGAEAGPDCAAGPDNCPLISNADQSDYDQDGAGDVCDGDRDGDGFANDVDNCPTLANSSQNDFDGNGVGDACDPDVDGDMVLNDTDLCPFTPLASLVDPATGCALTQLCPCEGPRGTSTGWKNHGKYVSCYAHATGDFIDQGLITDEQKGELVSAAAQSECGK